MIPLGIDQDLGQGLLALHVDDVDEEHGVVRGEGAPRSDMMWGTGRPFCSQTSHRV